MTKKLFFILIFFVFCTFRICYADYANLNGTWAMVSPGLVSIAVDGEYIYPTYTTPYSKTVPWLMFLATKMTVTGGGSFAKDLTVSGITSDTISGTVSGDRFNANREVTKLSFGVTTTVNEDYSGIVSDRNIAGTVRVTYSEEGVSPGVTMRGSGSVDSPFSITVSGSVTPTVTQADPTPASLNGKPVNDGNAESADPIHSVTGNMYLIATDLAITGRGLGFTFTRTYNSRENQTAPIGYGWTHSYNIYLNQNAQGVVALRDAEAKEYIFNPKGDGKYLSQRGDFSTLTKNASGWVWRKSNGIEYIFNAAGKLYQIKDRNSNCIVLTYGAQNRLAQITDTVGRQVQLDYDAANRVIRISDPSSRHVDYAYDAQNNLIKVTNPKGQISSYNYDSNHNLIKKTNAKGDSIYFTYDSLDRATSSKGELNNGRADLSYDPANKKTIVTDSKGNKTTKYYNDDWLINKVVDPAGKTELLSWDSQLNLNSRTDQLGRVTKMEYDAAGNLLKVTAADDSVTTFTYEPVFNLIKTATDSYSSVTNYFYDTNGNLIKVIDPLLGITLYSYDPKGELINSTNVLGKVSEFGYDTQGNLQTVKDALGNINTFAYDAVGNLLESKDAKGNINKYVYDELNQLQQITYPDNSHVSYAYDEVGNRISVVDQKSNTVILDYDWNKNLISTTDALGHTVNYEYDTEENLVCVTDQLGHDTKYEYDNLGRVISQTNALNITVRFQYDDAGNRVSMIDGKGQTIRYLYDNLNRLKKIIYPAAYGTVEYAYDSLGRCIMMTDSRGSSSYVYDKLGRLLKADGPAASDTVEYTYDKAGNRLSMKDPDGKTTSYVYDDLNRLFSITDPQGKTAFYTYDSVGNLATLTYPNGIKTQNVYDDLNRVTKIMHYRADNAADKLGEYNYTYDFTGRRTQVVSLTDNVRYNYDAAGQLTREARTTAQGSTSIIYNYDEAGNRLRMVNAGVEHSYAYNEINQLIYEDTPVSEIGKNITVTGTATDVSGVVSVAVNGAAATLTGNAFSCVVNLTSGQNIISVSAKDKAGNVGTKAIAVTYKPALKRNTSTYDSNGNLIRNSEPGKVVNYVYDAANRLVQVSGPDLSTSYAYDGDGKRVSSVDAGIAVNYLYDGSNVILERNSQGVTGNSYVRNPNAAGGIGGVIKQVSGANLETYYQYDGMGSVAFVTNSVGASNQAYSYDAFGNVIAKANARNIPYKFLTKQSDNSGLVYFGARYYNPAIGRFITQDPAGMIDGPNMYVYCGNDPVNLVDLWGLCAKQLWYDRLASWSAKILEEASDIVVTSIAINEPGVYSSTVITTIMECAMGILQYPSAIGHLGEATGTFLSCPSWQNSSGMLMDITIAASTLAIVGYEGRPYYQYYPEGNTAYSSPWLTRGWGWSPPYKVGAQAVEKLNLPSYNSGTAVRQVSVKPGEPVRGPRSVKRGNGQEYVRGWRWPS